LTVFNFLNSLIPFKFIKFLLTANGFAGCVGILGTEESSTHAFHSPGSSSLNNLFSFYLLNKTMAEKMLYSKLYVNSFKSNPSLFSVSMKNYRFFFKLNYFQLYCSLNIIITIYSQFSLIFAAYQLNIFY